jgi:hypothetical protein
MLHRLITRIASLLLVAGLLAAPAAADAKRHHKRHSVRHHLVKHSRAVVKSAGRIEGGTIGSEPTQPTQEEPPPVSDEPPSEPPVSDDPPSSEEPPSEEQPPAPPVAQPTDAGVVASYGEGALDVELGSGGHVTGKVGQFTQFSCRSLATGQAVTDSCDASLLTGGRHLHEFTVNYGPEGAWFARIIIVLP